jgi:sarcosine oxidase delta subunit
MNKYSNKISLIENTRGIWDLDPIKGCKYGMQAHVNGCYGACYANKSAKARGYNFANSVLRDFESIEHLRATIKKLRTIQLSFVRMGVTGDPSENWKHTIDICDKIKVINKRIVSKKIVIITKHWKKLPVKLYKKVKGLNLIINTSISAIDSDSHLKHRLNEYHKLKSICKSVLRIVSCDFNLNNPEGRKYNKIQESLFKNENIIDTVLRVPENHYLVTQGVINTEKHNFLSSKPNASMKNKNTYFGHCKDCPEMCGVNL